MSSKGTGGWLLWPARKTRGGKAPVVLFCLALFLGAGRAESKSFSVPPAGGKAVWEAEEAQREGQWEEVRHPWASGGVYLKPRGTGGDVVLEFPFHTDRFTTLRVWPVWWRHGERKSARRFPYPLPAEPGPDVVDWCGNLVFFTAPATGKVGVLDAATETLRGAIDLGGYLTDLVADRAAGKIYVANAPSNCIAVLDAKRQVVLTTIPVPPEPWSLALRGGNLYVACRRAKSVAVVNTGTNQVTKKASLPTAPLYLTVSKENRPRLLVWLWPQIFALDTLQERVPDKERYAFPRRVRFKADTATLNREFWIPKPHVLSLRRRELKEGVWSPWETKTIEVRAVTGSPKTAERFPFPFRDHPGPEVMDFYGNLLFFTSPSTGKVGVVDMDKETLVKGLEVGGYPADLVVDRGRAKVYVADAQGNRLVVLDARQQAVVKEVKVPTMPWGLALHGSNLFVACRADKSLVVLDTARDEVARKIPLKVEPLAVQPVPLPNLGWWPLLPDEEIPIALTPRLAVNLAPLALDALTLKEVAAIGVADFPPPKRRQIKWEPTRIANPEGEPAAKTFTGDNLHTIGVNGKKWINVSTVTDPQLLPQARPLAVGDVLGTVVFSLDGGPTYDWRRGIWMTPDQGLLLINGTDEFWRWNAPAFPVGPGEHVLRLRAGSPFAFIDGVKVSRSLAGHLTVKIVPRGEESPPEDPLPGYRSVFYDREPLRFKVALTNRREAPLHVQMRYTLRNYLGEAVASGQREITLEPGQTRDEWLEFPRVRGEAKGGIFHLTVTVDSADGQLIREHRFLRLPKLTHPRLLFRPEDRAEIKARIAQYPRLYQRYAAWLRRQVGKKGFLPPGLTKGSIVPGLPEEQRKLSQQGGWRRYDLAWRMLACQFAAMFLDPQQREFFQAKVASLLQEGRTDGYCTFHHHGPFFPGAVAALFDLATADLGEGEGGVQKFREFFASRLGDMNVFPWTLVALEEPLTPEKRALLFRLTMWLVNVERYFTAHQGTRGGRRWLNPRTGCHCPFAGYGYSFLYLRNFLNEDKFHQRKFVYGFLTHTELVHPRRDTRGLLGPVGPLGEPLKWIASSLSRHPLENRIYNWDDLVRRLNEEELTPAEVDQLLHFKEAAAPTQPMAFVVPIGLALGWYEPGRPKVDWEELPPTVLFDVEGDVIMRSDWGPDLTEVYFTCGARDHVYRHQPTHLRLAKAGEFLLGTASLWGDHGCATLAISRGNSWGNVVVVEPAEPQPLPQVGALPRGWRARWRDNLWHPRGKEYCLFNRFSDATFRYIGRNRRLVGYAPAEGGFGGGLDLHGHTESFFVQEGEILAYETWPEFDYVAGDATNSWPVEEVSSLYRQVVFVKPEVVVVYDRVTLGPRGARAYWLAATGPTLSTEGNGFFVQSGSSLLHGRVLFPRKPVLQTYNPKESEKYKGLFDRAALHQKVLEIHSPLSRREVEYLVVMNVGKEGTAPLAPRLIQQGDLVGVEFALPVQGEGLRLRLRRKQQQVRLLFRRRGPVGGHILLTGGSRTIDHEFVQRIDDSYRHWSADPRFRKWTTEPRFRFLFPAEGG
ncbi:MAG TPA: hypothetical protein EYP85_14880 [Armatimonadetes bacterium]|nr:hypothetical protein [Armatimonadota bacterium]